MDAASASTSRGTHQTRPTRIQPTRTRRGVVGFGNNEIDQQILDNMERRGDGEPHIPLGTAFCFTTDANFVPPPDASMSTGIKVNSLANERYFERPEVIKAYREQQTIQIPEFVRIDELPEGSSRFRPRADLGDFDSDAVYEKRHRKYENFEKRIRMREKEKLKHEQYKLKERLEQIRGMDPQAFLALPASAFTSIPTESAASGGEEDEEVAIYASVPGAPVSGASLYEGQRRRSEVVAAAEELAERYRTLLAPEKKRPGANKDTPETLSARPSIARTETDVPRTPVPTHLNRPQNTPSSASVRRASVATEASEPNEGPSRKRRKLAPSEIAPPSSPATVARTPSINDSVSTQRPSSSSFLQSTESSTLPTSVPVPASTVFPAPSSNPGPPASTSSTTFAPTQAPPPTPARPARARDEDTAEGSSGRPVKKQRTDANGPKPTSHREDSHPPIAVISAASESAKEVTLPPKSARPASGPRLISQKPRGGKPLSGPSATAISSTATPHPPSTTNGKAPAHSAHAEALPSADLPSVSRPTTPTPVDMQPGPSSLADDRPSTDLPPVESISAALPTTGRGRGRGRGSRGGGRGGRPHQLASASVVDGKSASASIPPGPYRPPPTCKIAMAAGRRSRGGRQVTAFGSKVGSTVEADVDFDLPPWLWPSKEEVDQRVLEGHDGLREWFEAKEREEEEERKKREEREMEAEEVGIDIEDDDEDEESGQDEGEPSPVKERQPSIPRWELNPEDEGEDEVDEMDDSDDAETIRIQAKPVKKRPRKNAKASTANGKDHPKTAKASGARTGKLAVKVGKGKGRQKPLQKRIKLMLSGTRSEQEEEDELRSEEDKNHEISHDFS
ncbi:hypothetical protein EV121DRAFT_216080 [Schizophyllum commune]